MKKNYNMIRSARKIFHLALFLVVIFCLFPYKDASAATFNLSGKITNSEGEGIVGATVDILESNTINIVESTTSVSEGNYNINVEEGTYDIQVSPPSESGLADSTTTDYVISSNSVLNITLVPSPVTVNGIITDYLGNPLEDVNVLLQNISVGGSFSERTNVSGAYTINVPAGHYSVLIDTNTDITPSVNIPQNWQVGTSDITISENKTINYSVQVKQVEVHVEDADNNPVEDAKITVNGLTVNNLMLGGVTAFGSSSYQDGITTDVNGVATLLLYSTNSEDGNYTFIVTPPSGNPNTVAVVQDVSVTEDRTLTVTLSPPVTVSGTVTDYLDNPLENSIVTLSNQFINTPFVVQTDSDGHYTSEVPVGIYSLLIEGTPATIPSTHISPTWQVGLQNINISDDKVINYIAAFKELEVHVKGSDDLPIEGVLIKVDGLTNNHLTLDGQTAFGSSSYQNGITTDVNGVAMLYLYETNTEDGNYTLVLTPPEESIYTTTVVSDVSLTEDKTLSVELVLPVTLSGVITDYLGGPLEESTVTINNLLTGSQFVTKSGSNGHYSLDIPPGKYSILMDGNTTNTASTVIPEEWQIGAQEISIQDNKTINHIVEVKRVDVHVQDPSDNPIEGVRIQVDGPTNNQLTLDGQSASGTSSYQNGTLTNASGDTTVWLYTTNEEDGDYTFTVTPSEESIYSPFNLTNVSVISDQTEIISLQYNHATPVTTIDLSPEANGEDEYSDPTTVTLSATATEGYTVANTYYTVDGGSQQTYSESFMVMGEGEHTITYWSVDNSGVLETHKTETFTIHNAEPITVTFDASGDTYVRGGNDNRNLGAGEFMRIQSNGNNRSLVQFDQQALQTTVGSNSSILSAKLRVTIVDNGNNWGATGRTVDVHRLLSEWVEGNGTENDRGTGSGATWSCATDSIIQNQAKNCNGTTEWEMGQPNNPNVHPWVETATDTETITNNQTGVAEYDVTADVESFLNGTNQNYGWIIKKTNEGKNGQVSFGTRESSSIPQLVVTYQP